jgi:hypothetical protein
MPTKQKRANLQNHPARQGPGFKHIAPVKALLPHANSPLQRAHFHRI